MIRRRIFSWLFAAMAGASFLFVLCTVGGCEAGTVPVTSAAGRGLLGIFAATACIVASVAIGGENGA